MNSYYCDTSAVIKWYHYEKGSEWIDSIFDDMNNSIIISEITTVEFYSAILKKLRTKEINNEAQVEVVKLFNKDCLERFIITNLNSTVLKKAQMLIKNYGENNSIRTLDSIQLASYLSDRCQDSTFVCSDINLVKISKFEGVNVVNPESI